MVGKSICLADDCDRIVQAHGWCSMHYYRWKVNGDPDKAQWRKGVPVVERLLSRTDRTTLPDCWLWTGYVSPNGYGQLSLVVQGDRQKISAHRLSYLLFVGPIFEGLTVDHLCHNADPNCIPKDCLHRRCVNPSHLDAVPIRENQARSPSYVGYRTHCKYGHEWVNANIKVFANGKRRCNICWIQWHKDHPRGPRNRSKK